MLPKFSQNLTLQEAFETAVDINFLLIDFHFFTKRRQSVEKMIHQKKNRGHRTSNIVKSTKIAKAIHPIIAHFYYLLRALMHGVACKFASAETISANALNKVPAPSTRFQNVILLFNQTLTSSSRAGLWR